MNSAQFVNLPASTAPVATVDPVPTPEPSDDDAPESPATLDPYAGATTWQRPSGRMVGWDRGRA